MNVMKPLFWASRLEQAWSRVPHLQTWDSNKLSHASGYATIRFGFGGGLAKLPSQSKPVQELNLYSKQI